MTTHVDHPESVEKKDATNKHIDVFAWVHRFKDNQIGGFCCSAASKRFIWMQALRDWLCAGSGRVQILENKRITYRGESCFSETTAGG